MDDPIASGEYPPPSGYGPSGINYGYAFPVEGPTEPSTSPQAEPGTPWEYMSPQQTSALSKSFARRHYPRMPNDPFGTHKQNQETEMGWGEGRFPDPIGDYSGGGSKNRFPIADPDAQRQQLNLAAIRRTDLSDPFAALDYYAAGNTDRYGAQPPLVRKRFKPTRSTYHRPPRPRMVREW